MRINYNVSAMRANNALNVSDRKLSKSLEKLSSGLKITESKDAPSGYAIGRRMNAQIEGLSVASKDANNGISIIETADGALSEVHEMLQRMNELAVKGATGTLTTTDRSMLQAEMKQLKEEVTRIARDTEFNGQTILDGSFDLRGYTNNENVKLDYYADEVLKKKYTIDSLTVQYTAEGEIDMNATSAACVLGEGFPAGAKITDVYGDKITITADQGFEIRLKVTADPVTDTEGNITGYNPVELAKPANPGDPSANPPIPATAAQPLILDATGIGSMDTQIGANEGQQLAIRIPTISLDRLELEDTDLSTQDSCKEAINDIKGAILYVSDVRSRLGAYQNRLEHTVSSLGITSESMTSAYSRIMDVDMAEEMTNYTTEQVISQAATSMLAQANERPSQVLQLLQ